MNGLSRYALVAVLAGLAIWGAQAQSSPSADQIINALKPVPAAPMASPFGATRGLRPVSQEAPKPAEPAPAPSVNLTVQFATNSTVLTPEAVKTLSELGRALSSDALGGYRFRIEGHTDTVGSAEANKALSERRAKAVVAFLVKGFRIEPGRLDAVGMGEDGLLVQTPANVAEPRNRRVQVINLGS